MGIKIVAVFHGAKVSGVTQYPTAVGANPPMTIEGMAKAQADLVEKVRAHGPYVCGYTSRLARACDMMSVLATALDLDFVSMKGLGQHGNLDNGTVIMYPGCEDENYVSWQNNAMGAIQDIGDMHECGDTILVVGHRPTLGALVALTQEITDIDGLKQVVNDPATVGEGFRVFEYHKHGGELQLVV
ncbi:MAG: hypothetical protein WCO03_00895 [bacterium]